jgi:hypothetical protein
VLRLADDTRVTVTVPHAGVDLIANLRAGLPVTVLGAPVPGRRVLLGISGAPLVVCGVGSGGSN